MKAAPGFHRRLLHLSDHPLRVNRSAAARNRSGSWLRNRWLAAAALAPETGAEQFDPIRARPAAAGICMGCDANLHKGSHQANGTKQKLKRN
jgi:hypothetical protein